jgi:hypothetical protein
MFLSGKIASRHHTVIQHNKMGTMGPKPTNLISDHLPEHTESPLPAHCHGNGMVRQGLSAVELHKRALSECFQVLLCYSC